MIYIFFTLNIIFLATGQVLWKVGMSRLGEFNLIKIILNPYIIGGIALYAIATVLWLYIISRENLSSVYPLQSLTYIIGTIFAIFIFHEEVSLIRWIGVFIIFLGAIFVVAG